MVKAVDRSGQLKTLTYIYSRRIDPADHRTRIRLAAACCDCDHIPKVDNAGGYIEVGGVQCQVMHNGVVVRRGGYYGEWMSQIIELLRGHHEPQEEHAFHSVLKAIGPGAVMIEGGSFWSYYSLWFRRAIADSRTIMIEPDPDRLAVGRENFHLNGYRGEFFQAYIGNAPQRASEATGSVRTITVDSLMRRLSLKRVAMVHMDIQGAESRMLRGARRSLEQRSIDFMFISTHRDETRHVGCIDALTSLGYEIICQHTKRDSFSYDGLVVARSPEAPAVEPIAVSSRSAFAAHCGSRQG